MANPEEFKIESQVEGPVVTVRLFGEIESAHIRQIEDQFIEHVKARRLFYLLDLTHLSFINSMGLGFLAAWSERVKGEQGGLKIASLSENLQDLFYLTQMDKILAIYPDVAAARAAFKTEFPQLSN